MLKRTNLILLNVLLIMSSNVPASARGNSRLTIQGFYSSLVFTSATNDREQDGLVGPVRRVRTETARIATKNGKPVEGERVVLETATYDIRGNKVDTAYFLVAGATLTGKEVYKYDDKGNMTEMTLHNTDGSVLSKEAYAYEFDQVGNWMKMTTSVAILEGGKVTYEPTEVTYRSVAYFLEENVARMMQPAAAPNGGTATASALVASSSTDGKVPAAVSFASSNAAVPTSTAGVATPKSTSKMTVPTVAALNKVEIMAPSPAISGTSLGVAANSGVVAKIDDEAPPKPVVRGPLKPVSGGLLNGKAVSLPMPLYPEMARRVRTTGMVTVDVVIDVTGKVISAKASNGPMMLQQAAERAALQARFSPTLLSGQPVKVSGIINYNFTLSQ